MPPPGHMATTEPRVEQISAVSDTDLTTRTQQMRYLVQTCGVTRRQAHALIKAYEADMERPLVTARRTYRAHFIDWLMRQAPGPGLQRGVLKHEWRTASA